jgi:hypothetical protein
VGETFSVGKKGKCAIVAFGGLFVLTTANTLLRNPVIKNDELSYSSEEPISELIPSSSSHASRSSELHHRKTASTTAPVTNIESFYDKFDLNDFIVRYDEEKSDLEFHRHLKPDGGLKDTQEEVNKMSPTEMEAYIKDNVKAGNTKGSIGYQLMEQIFRYDYTATDGSSGNGI